uniref:Secreted Mys2-like protein n=1 Tax=Pristhesancus plagipennis TaxID=1955184 RepID=A0A2K8JPF5_PRIPG|nr:secreted Mys2-like protein [Pristhesancus plagipennis]
MSYINRKYSTAILFLIFINFGGSLAESSNSDESIPNHILCYQCNSAYDPRCGDPFEPFSLGKVNCSLLSPLEHLPDIRPTICRKNVQKVYGKVRVVRGCGYLDDEYLDGKCLYRSGTFNVLAQYCSCRGDLCNTGNKHGLVTALLFFSITALFYTTSL